MGRRSTDELQENPEHPFVHMSSCAYYVVYYDGIIKNPQSKQNIIDDIIFIICLLLYRALWKRYQRQKSTTLFFSNASYAFYFPEKKIYTHLNTTAIKQNWIHSIMYIVLSHEEIGYSA